MIVRKNDILKAIDQLDLKEKVVMIHSSMKSFGHVKGGPRTIIDGFLSRGYTVLVPSFSYNFEADPMYEDRPERNACYYEDFDRERHERARIFHVESNEIVASMGALPASLLKMQGRSRGYHPMNSFAAIGPLADELIREQDFEDVYGPLKKMMEIGGNIILMGVDLRRMTALHLSEELSGRNLFIRWAKDREGQIKRIHIGSCSDGFNNFKDILKDLETSIEVGKSLWRLFPMKETVELARTHIEKDQRITHCGNELCIRCDASVAGGPII